MPFHDIVSLIWFMRDAKMLRDSVERWTRVRTSAKTNAKMISPSRRRTSETSRAAVFLAANASPSSIVNAPNTQKA